MRLAGIPHLRLRLAIVAAVTIAAVTACSGSAAPAGTHPAPAPPAYYLALGDSLSQGVQPDAAGVSVETRYGYPDQVYAALRPSHPTLKLVKLGCPGETTGTMINGGLCRYQGGSQLAAAAVTRLTTIMARLKAAGPGVRIVGMNYYLPALAEWRNGLPGHLVAWAAERLAATYNNLLDRVYTSAGARVANVFGAFEVADFAEQGTTPRNVALLCQWTWECAAPPRGPNQHANQAGYQVIARTLLEASGLS
jgi:lysophospholipase L1-like esterase